MSITTNLIGIMATASSDRMKSIRDRLQAAATALDEEVVNDPLAFLYQDLYDAIETLNINIDGAVTEEERAEKYRIENAKYGDQE